MSIRTTTSSLLLPVLLALLIAFPRSAAADDDGVPNVQLGHEYTEYNKTGRGSGGGGGEAKPSTISRVLLYIPDRIMDLFDIFRLDIGIGPSLGGVVRVTKYAQAGYRQMLPFSLRAGLAGRHSPVFIESSNEFGAGPAFVSSSDRHVERAEVGLGVDLLVAGVYFGIDFGAVPDFFAGFVGFDPSKDDF